MEAVLKACAVLLRDDHPYRQFNVETFRRMGFVRKVSYVLKSDTENVETSNASVVYQIVDLLSALVGSPPDLSIVKDLMSMALLLHESNQVIIFYFLQNDKRDRDIRPKPDNQIFFAEAPLAEGTPIRGFVLLRAVYIPSSS